MTAAMSSALLDSPSDQEVDLQGLVANLLEEVAQLRGEVSGLRFQMGYWKRRHADSVRKSREVQQDLDQAHAEIRELKADLFGRKSEKHRSGDRSNHLDDPDEQDAEKKKKRGQQANRPGPSRRDYSHLPVREEAIELPLAECVCEECGKPLTELANTEDSEQLEIEVEVFRRRLRRKRYQTTCRCGPRQTITAPKPDKLIGKGRYGVSIWTHLLLEKFHSQRPIGRAIEQLALHGLKLAPGTIAGGLKRVGPLLEPIYNALIRRNGQSSYHQADETRWLVLAEKEGKKNHRWWLWVFAGEDSVVYVLDPSRSHEVPQSHFPADAQGVLMVDRYSAYKAMEQVKAEKLVLAFCWAHVRRDFIRVGKGYPELKPWALEWLCQIRELYRLNHQRRAPAPDSPEPSQADSALRQHVAAIAQQRDTELADSKLRQPCRKILVSLNAHWSGLTLFLDDRRIPLDNNYSERLIRNPAVGRKNYYGSGSEWSGRLATTMFSLLATLKLWGINPRRWLTWYLNGCASAEGKSPADIESFLPWNLSDERLANLRGETPDTS
jgi:transposase